MATATAAEARVLAVAAEGVAFAVFQAGLEAGGAATGDGEGSGDDGEGDEGTDFHGEPLCEIKWWPKLGRSW